MSKRIDFLFVTADDVQDIDQYLRRAGAVVLQDELRSPTAERIDTIHPEIANSRLTFTYVTMPDLAERVQYDFVKTTSRYSISALRSPVVKVSNFLFDPDRKILTSMSCYMSSAHEQPPEFIRFVDKFFRWLRTTYKINVRPGLPQGSRVSDGAAKFSDSGGRLTPYSLVE